MLLVNTSLGDWFPCTKTFVTISSVFLISIIVYFRGSQYIYFLSYLEYILLPITDILRCKPDYLTWSGECSDIDTKHREQKNKITLFIQRNKKQYNCLFQGVPIYIFLILPRLPTYILLPITNIIRSKPVFLPWSGECSEIETKQIEQSNKTNQFFFIKYILVLTSVHKKIQNGTPG